MPPFSIEVALFAFTVGLCVGSFLNVCIYRVPEKRSIVHPPSSCPACGSGIKAYDNVPVLGYLWLRGRCRSCKAPISFRYPVVELITGLAALCVYLKFGATLQAPVYFIFIATLIVITFIDIDHQIIPDIISLPGIPIFFLGSFLLPAVTFTEALLGIAVGGGLLYAIAWLYFILKRREGMGGGDIKLLAMIGPVVGWRGVLFTLFASSALGTVVGVLLMAVSKSFKMDLKIPFGPFLALGAVTYIFFGEAVILWYIGLHAR